MTATALGTLAMLASLVIGVTALIHEHELAGRDRLSYSTAKTAVEAQICLALLGVALLIAH